MAQGGEACGGGRRLGVAGAAQQGGGVHINPVMFEFDHQLAARRDGASDGLRAFQLGAMYGDSGVLGRGDEVVVVLFEDPGAVFDASGNIARQASPVAGRAQELLGVLRGAPGAVFDNFSSLARQARLGGGRGEQLPDVLRGGPGAVFDSSGNFARETRPGTRRGDELLGQLLDNPGNFLGEPLAGAGRSAEGIVGVLRDSNLGTVVGSAGTMAGRLRRSLPVVGILASSAAVTGLAGGTASPAAGFGLFALLLGGLSLVIFHARRV